MTQSHEAEHKRLLAIGDIHGCLGELTLLLQMMAPTDDDKLIFLGDYIDRGPDSASVITFLLKFQRQFPNTVFLRGNHEQMLLDVLKGHDPAVFLVNGGVKTVNSYEAAGAWPIPEEHRIFLERTEHFYETENFFFVHAGLRPGVPLAEQDPSDMLWIRQDFVDSSYDWGKTIVYGHTPLPEPLLTSQRIGLDTGCGYGRQLTGCDVTSHQIWQISNQL